MKTLFTALFFLIASTSFAQTIILISEDKIMIDGRKLTDTSKRTFHIDEIISVLSERFTYRVYDVNEEIYHYIWGGTGIEVSFADNGFSLSLYANLVNRKKYGKKIRGMNGSINLLGIMLDANTTYDNIKTELYDSDKITTNFYSNDQNTGISIKIEKLTTIYLFFNKKSRKLDSIQFV